MTAERRHDSVALGILFAVPTILFFDVLVQWNVLYERDVATFFHPAKKILRDIILGGDFPYWNRWFSAGQPLASNPQFELFYPPAWLVLLPPFEYWFQFLIVLHVYIAIFGMYAFLRSLPLRRAAAVFGAASFATGGLLLSTLNLLPILFALAWLPAVCLFTRKFLRERRPRDFAVAALFLGLQVLVGEPMTILQTGLLLGLYAIASGWQERSPGIAFRRIADVAAVSAAALLVSAAQTLPAIDLVRDTVRSRGFDLRTVSGWSMPWQRLPEFLFPHFLGHALPDSGLPYWGAQLYGTPATPYLFSIYPGLAIAVFCVAGALARIRGTAFFLTVSLTSLVLAAGSHTPLLHVLYDAGLVRSLRYPEKFLLFGGFAAITFAAVSFDAFLEGAERVRRAAIAACGAVVLLAITGAGLTFSPLYAAFLKASFGWTQVFPSIVRSAKVGWLIATAVSVLLLLLLRNARTRRRRAWLLAFALFVLIDLAPLAIEIAPRMPASFYTTEPPVVAQMKTMRDQFRLFHYAEWDRNSTTARAFRYNHPEVANVLRNSLSPMVPAEYGIMTVLEPDYDRTALLRTDEFMRLIPELNGTDWLTRLAAMSNVGAVALYDDPAAALRRAGGSLRDVRPVKIVPGRAAPRYYFASVVQSIEGRDDFISQLRHERAPLDAAFVEGQSFVPARGRVRSVVEGPNDARIEVEAAGRSFLVMSVTTHKYWSLTIDGAAADPVVTNIAYQGVVVPEGRHVIEMRYRNPLIPAGVAISLATLIALIAVAVRSLPAPDLR